MTAPPTFLRERNTLDIPRRRGARSIPSYAGGMAMRDAEAPTPEPREITILGQPDSLMFLSILRWVGKLGPIGRILRRSLAPVDDNRSDGV